MLYDWFHPDAKEPLFPFALVMFIWPHFLTSLVEGASICFICPTVLIHALFLRICALLWHLIAAVGEYRLYIVTLRFNPIPCLATTCLFGLIVQKFDLSALTFKPTSRNLIIIAPSHWRWFFRFPKVMPSRSSQQVRMSLCGGFHQFQHLPMEDIWWTCNVHQQPLVGVLAPRVHDGTDSGCVRIQSEGVIACIKF